MLTSLQVLEKEKREVLIKWLMERSVNCRTKSSQAIQNSPSSSLTNPSRCFSFSPMDFHSGDLEQRCESRAGE
jgi:hypothetical protein